MTKGSRIVSQRSLHYPEITKGISWTGSLVCMQCIRWVEEHRGLVGCTDLWDLADRKRNVSNHSPQHQSSTGLGLKGIHSSTRPVDCVAGAALHHATGSLSAGAADDAAGCQSSPRTPGDPLGWPGGRRGESRRCRARW